MTLHGNRVIVDESSYDEVILEWNGPLIQEYWCPYKKEEIGTQTHTQGEYHVKMKAEIGVTLL